jgi:sec-independent protein translocase protein TatB
MFNIGLAEFIVIAIAALVLLGPDNLPSALRSLARVIRDFRRMSSQLRDQLDPEFHEVTSELRDALDGREALPRIEPPVLPLGIQASQDKPMFFQGLAEPPKLPPVIEPAPEGGAPGAEPQNQPEGYPVPRASSSGEHGS